MLLSDRDILAAQAEGHISLEPSRGGGAAQPNRPLFVCLHGWGSNEDDLAGMMQYVAPYNDFVSLRAPITLQEPSTGGFFAQPGAYSWLRAKGGRRAAPVALPAHQ